MSLKDDKCIWCGENDDLQIHHLVPTRKSKRKSNSDYGVMICSRCHYLIHYLFTNFELAKMSLREQRDAVLKERKVV